MLAKYLETVPSFVKNKNVLELGAGTGLAGMAAILLGAKAALLTGILIASLLHFRSYFDHESDRFQCTYARNIHLVDLPYALDNLNRNIEHNLRKFLKVLFALHIFTRVNGILYFDTAAFFHICPA